MFVIRNIHTGRYLSGHVSGIASGWGTIRWAKSYEDADTAEGIARAVSHPDFVTAEVIDAERAAARDAETVHRY